MIERLRGENAARFLARCRDEVRLARERCPHWDMEADGMGHGCCYAVRDAIRDVHDARDALDREVTA